LKDKMLEYDPSYSDRDGEIHLETDIFYSYDADNRNDYDD